MQIISFTGKSGTGKSYNANRIASEENIDAIIDDGLLIYKGQVVAGSSAKRCKSKAAAMRTALFNYEENKQDVMKAIKKYKPEKILVLGTSDKMANWITDELMLPRASKRIYIEDVTTKEEREKADYSRHVEGQHIIPAPIGELKKDFAGYFINPIRYFKAMLEDGSQGKEAASESTVVRPQFSYCGSFSISSQVVRDIVKIAASELSTSLHVVTVIERGRETNLSLTIEIKILSAADIKRTCIYLQEQIYTTIEKMTAFSVRNINIKVVGIAASVIELHEKETLWKELL